MQDLLNTLNGATAWECTDFQFDRRTRDARIHLTLRCPYDGPFHTAIDGHDGGVEKDGWRWWILDSDNVDDTAVLQMMVEPATPEARRSALDFIIAQAQIIRQEIRAEPEAGLVPGAGGMHP